MLPNYHDEARQFFLQRNNIMYIHKHMLHAAESQSSRVPINFTLPPPTSFTTVCFQQIHRESLNVYVGQNFTFRSASVLIRRLRPFKVSVLVGRIPIKKRSRNERMRIKLKLNRELATLGFSITFFLLSFCFFFFFFSPDRVQQLLNCFPRPRSFVPLVYVNWRFP